MKRAVVPVLAGILSFVVTVMATDVPEFLRSDAPQSPRLVTKLNEAKVTLNARLAAVESIAGTDGNVVVADGKTLKAIAAGSTNTLITAGKLAAAELSGNVAVTRIATALTTPGAIGGTTPAAGAFTTLSASGAATLNGSVTVIGTGVTNRWDDGSGAIDATKLSGNVAVTRIATALTTPGAIGGTTPAAGTFTGVTAGKASVASGVITMTGTTSGTATLTVADDGSAITVNKPVSAAINGTVGATTPAAGAFTTLDASGVATLAGDTHVNGAVRYTGISDIVSNGQELVTTLARGTYLYTPTEVATNTVADPTASGDWVAFINVGTNDMVVAKAANLALGGATRTLGTYDILVLRAASAAVWVEESFTDNTVGP